MRCSVQAQLAYLLKTVTKIHQMLLLNIINIGIVVFWSVDGAFMTNYLTKKEFCFSPFGMTDFGASVVLNIGQIMIVAGLLIGYWSDRTRTRMGKRIPYLLSGAVIVLIFYSLISFFNNLISIIILQVIVYFFVVWIAIPYYALIPDVTPADKLSTCNAFFSLFGAVGTIVGYAVVGGILCDQCKYPQLYRYLPFFATSAILLFFTLITVLSIREDKNYNTTDSKEQNPKSPNHQSSNHQINKLTNRQSPISQSDGFIQWVKNLFADLKIYKDLLWFTIFNFFLWMGLQGFVKFFTRFMDNDMGVPLDTASIALGVLPIVVMVLAVPVGILGDKINRKGLLIFGVLLTLGAMLLGYFIIPPNVRKSVIIKQNRSVVKKYNYKECLSTNPNACLMKTLTIMDKLKLLKQEPLRTTAIILAIASAGLCIVFILMAAIAPTLMPANKIGEFMGFLSATTGLGGAVGLLISGAASTLLVDSIHCRVIFIIGVVCFALSAVMLLKVKIKNAWELTA